MSVNLPCLVGKRHRFRLALCGHKAAEAGAACLVLMVQGHLAGVTLAHLLIAAKTGSLAAAPAVGVTFTRYARHLADKWTASIFMAICAFVADAAVHGSHYSGEYTEAALTGIGAFAFSILTAHTPIGRSIDRLAEASWRRDRTPRSDTASIADYEMS